VDDVHGYVFRCDGRAVAVAWADPELVGDGWSLRATARADIHDIVGAPVDGPEVALTSSPVYLVSRTASAKELAASCAFPRPDGRAK